MRKKAASVTRSPALCWPLARPTQRRSSTRTIEGQHPAWDCFRRPSITLLREVGDQADAGLALYQMGRLLIERGRTQPARNTLREALDIATRSRLGIAYELQQILAEL